MNNDDAPKASSSTWTKARKKGDKFYRPFAIDDPEWCIQMLLERYGEQKLAAIFSKVTGCGVMHTQQIKQQLAPLNAAMVKAFTKKQ